MDTPFVKRVYRTPRQHIAYLRFVLESYDGLAFIRTLDSRQALVEIAYPPSRRLDAEALLSALAQELPLEEQDPAIAADYPPL
ncbi:DUF4911 domain-containing protein [Desulfuromonas sp. KJ2020]|uniref:DUF4911 domain-containing protein n=1 Tax=Desulfuromonas sp. KJ2020 TaxID=2919173 RepID=UPI0020A7FDAC|nr:DUF4911 domain-containing protein [Desulfuromonas sp. KJ2020]MCP3176665.1 DUF4911 domain-containing protein [Desulfuromonas sp. KJ2020]